MPVGFVLPSEVRHAHRVAFEGLEPATDVSVGDWIAPRLRGFGGRVNQVVPDGFAAYARVLHPPQDEHGQSVSWPKCAVGPAGRLIR